MKPATMDENGMDGNVGKVRKHIKWMKMYENILTEKNTFAQKSIGL